ncbi:TylF/MycF/NovP-related O-methyltransferase [Candidatus Aenigmatarchaeota archaeon]
MRKGNTMDDIKKYTVGLINTMGINEFSPAWKDDEEFLELCKKMYDKTLVSHHRLFFLYQFAKYANALSGNFAQIGIFKGGSAKMVSLVKDKSKKFYLFDTFEGLPEPDPVTDKHDEAHVKGEFAEPIENVKKLFEDDDSIELVKGVFPETGKIIENEKFSFVYIDVDVYKSNYETLEFFYDRMVPGGVIIFDDYEWKKTPGIKKSICDFLEKRGAKERPIITTKYQCIIIKL